MVTIKDIALAAGVSHGTVSNVLNKKGNVSAKKVKIVEEVALSMGYNLNNNAKLLRQGTTNNVSIIIPDINIKRYRDFYIGVSKILEENFYQPTLFISNNIFEREKEFINKALSERAHSIVLISCLDKKDETYKEMNFHGTKLFCVERKIKANNLTGFYSFNPKEIGSEIGKYINKENHKNIVYFSNRKIYSFENEIFTNLKKTLKAEKSILDFSCNTNENLKKSLSISREIKKIDIIVTTTTEKAESIKKALLYYEEEKIPEIITLSSVTTSPSTDFSEYELNYQHLGILLGEIICGNKSSMKLKNDGFVFKKNKKIEVENKKLKILCIETPSAYALRDMSSLIEKLFGISYEVDIYSYSECYSLIKSGEIDETYDLIRIDIAWLSKFGKTIFSSFDSLDYNFDLIFDNILAGLEKEYSYIDDKIYSLPFDPSIQLLFYRKDLFENPVLSRLYFEKYKEELKPPVSFAQYNRIAAFFTKKYNDESLSMYGMTNITRGYQPLSCQFLPYYKELGGEIIDDENNINIDMTLLEKALDNQLEGLKYCSEKNYKFWTEVMLEFIMGKTAMTIVFSNTFSQIINSKKSKIIGKYESIPLPNNSHLIGGGAIGIHKKSKNKDLAFEFLKILYSDKIALLFTSLCGSSSNKAVYYNEEILGMYPWLKLVKKSILDGKRRFKSNTLTEFEFEITLGEILEKFLKQDISKQKTLELIGKIKF